MVSLLVHCNHQLLTNSGPVATLLQLWLSIGLSGTPSVQVLIAQSGPVDCSAGRESSAAIWIHQDH